MTPAAILCAYIFCEPSLAKIQSEAPQLPSINHVRMQFYWLPFPCRNVSRTSSAYWTTSVVLLASCYWSMSSCNAAIRLYPWAGNMQRISLRWLPWQCQQLQIQRRMSAGLRNLITYVIYKNAYPEIIIIMNDHLSCWVEGYLEWLDISFSRQLWSAW